MFTHKFEKPTSKLYFNKYPFKVCFKVPTSGTGEFASDFPDKSYDLWPEDVKKTYDIIEEYRHDFCYFRDIKNTPYNLELIKVNRELRLWLRTKDYDSVKERTHVYRTLFIQDFKDYQDLIDTYPSYIMQAERPINTDHQGMLEAGQKIVYRKNFFWRGYRFRIGFWHTPDLFEQCQPWLLTYFENKTKEEYKYNTHMSKAMRETGYPRYYRNRKYFYGHVLYLANEEDLFMLKLALSDCIAFVERAMTFEEIGTVETVL